MSTDFSHKTLMKFEDDAKKEGIVLWFPLVNDTKMRTIDFSDDRLLMTQVDTLLKTTIPTCDVVQYELYWDFRLTRKLEWDSSPVDNKFPIKLRYETVRKDTKIEINTG